MSKAGWTLIIVGLFLIVVRSLIDWMILLRARPADGPADTRARGVRTLAGVLDPEKFVELLKAPHGAGVALVIIGAGLLLASSGFNISFGGAVNSPTPSPSPS